MWTMINYSQRLQDKADITAERRRLALNVNIAFNNPPIEAPLNMPSGEHRRCKLCGHIYASTAALGAHCCAAIEQYIYFCEDCQRVSADDAFAC